MATNKFTTYYNYLLKNWNKSIATYIINAEKIGELKYGIESVALDKLQSLKKEGVNIAHSNIYMPVPYNILQHFLEKLNIGNYHHFLDIGCGKARVMCVAAHYGFKKVSGIEFSKTLIEQAKINIAITQTKIPKTKFILIHNDAFYFAIPNTVDCIFLFNPFDEVIMSGVIRNILKSVVKKPRNISVIYINPLHKNLFTAVGFKEKHEFKKLKYLEGVLLELKLSNK